MHLFYVKVCFKLMRRRGCISRGATITFFVANKLKMIQNGDGGAGYFRQKCRVISQNKYVFWLLNFI